MGRDAHSTNHSRQSLWNAIVGESSIDEDADLCIDRCLGHQSQPSDQVPSEGSDSWVGTVYISATAVQV